MKVIKLTAKMKKMYASELLIEVGAANKAGTRGYPEHFYFSREDYEALRKVMLSSEAKAAGEKKPSRRTVCAVEMSLLNLGPSLSYQEAIKPGYALLDVAAIKAKETKNAK